VPSSKAASTLPLDLAPAAAQSSPNAKIADRCVLTPPDGFQHGRLGFDADHSQTAHAAVPHAGFNHRT
jgi:hypothetical protein